jgi:hypothetical protein
MYVLIYDATGRVTGSLQQPASARLPDGMIECTAEQAGAFAQHRVDLSGATPAVVGIDAATWLNTLKVQLSADIDQTVASVYATWMRFQAEYEGREAAAQAYKDAGYTGDVSVWISGFADAANKTAQEATDLILQQSVSLRGALEQLGTIRMRKYEVLMAADCDTASAAHASIIAAIQAVAASIH